MVYTKFVRELSLKGVLEWKLVREYQLFLIPPIIYLKHVLKWKEDIFLFERYISGLITQNSWLLSELLLLRVKSIVTNWIIDAYAVHSLWKPEETLSYRLPQYHICTFADSHCVGGRLPSNVEPHICGRVN